MVSERPVIGCSQQEAHANIQREFDFAGMSSSDDCEKKSGERDKRLNSSGRSCVNGSQLGAGQYWPLVLVPCWPPGQLKAFRSQDKLALLGSRRVALRSSPPPSPETGVKIYVEVPFTMGLRKLAALGIVLGAATFAPPSVSAQNCTATQAAAVQCFVANAVATKITSPRYGMTLPQFEAYGVAVSQIVQTHHTYLMLIGMASAISDALPPTNENGTANLSAQDLAVTQIADAAIAGGFVTPPAGTTAQDLQWFTLDLVTAMNDNEGTLQMLTPGVGFRMIDSYIVTETSGATVNWTLVDSNLSTAVDSLMTSGLMKLPDGHTAAQVKTLIDSLAKAIYAYKVSTKRTSL